MTRIEEIRLSHEGEWVKQLSHKDQMAELREDSRTYDYEAPYYVESRSPRYNTRKPYMHCPFVTFEWSLSHARIVAYKERKKGNDARIYNNDTGEEIEEPQDFYDKSLSEKDRAMRFYKRLNIDQRINLKGNYAIAAAEEYDGYDDSLFFPLASAEGLEYIFVAYVFYGNHPVLWSELLTELTKLY